MREGGTHVCQNVTDHATATNRRVKHCERVEVLGYISASSVCPPCGADVVQWCHLFAPLSDKPRPKCRNVVLDLCPAQSHEGVAKFDAGARVSEEKGKRFWSDQTYRTRLRYAIQWQSP